MRMATGEAVLRGAAGARVAADRLVSRLSRELAEAKQRCAALEAELAARAGSGSTVAAEVERREAIARPALVARLQGCSVPHGARLRRNVALHSLECPPASAPLASWRRAQRGQRLGSTDVVTQPSLRADASPFCPGLGRWETVKMMDSPSLLSAVTCILTVVSLIFPSTFVHLASLILVYALVLYVVLSGGRPVKPLPTHGLSKMQAMIEEQLRLVVIPSPPWRSSAS
ncbi:unnamed protein product [Prorocentrum cordatum]|uniref:PRA1 family protein n=1 Tax=Prorocentrum cordatum TaxID=2364126 RepID=A0ABN9RJH4_9DINO|nr:unnamed protein product [Polarella glacialis]